MSSLAPGAIATYSCDARCTLVPPDGDLRTCVMFNDTHGEWSGEVPSCICKKIDVYYNVIT